MSSPSSAGSNAGKRKRTNTLPSNKTTPAMEQLQPSSRDASGEDGESTAPESANSNHKKTNSIESSNPPAKRLRSGTHEKIANGSDNAQDPGEPSDTTEGSTDIAKRIGRKGRKSVSKDQDPSAEHENTVSMAPPPLGEMVHPVGYRTNPPPVGRAVRVYADGVFDMFHLGYALQIMQLRSSLLTSLQTHAST